MWSLKWTKSAQKWASQPYWQPRRAKKWAGRTSVCGDVWRVFLACIDWRNVNVNAAWRSGNVKECHIHTVAIHSRNVWMPRNNILPSVCIHVTSWLKSPGAICWRSHGLTLELHWQLTSSIFRSMVYLTGLTTRTVAALLWLGLNGAVVYRCLCDFCLYGPPTFFRYRVRREPFCRAYTASQHAGNWLCSNSTRTLNINISS